MIHQARIRFMFVATSVSIVALALAVCYSNVAQAATAHASVQKVIGSQSHAPMTNIGQTASTTSDSASPDVTYVCDVYDYTGRNQTQILLQVAIGCPVPADIVTYVYLDYCSDWNRSELYCIGEWVRQPTSASCHATNSTWTKCPSVQLPVTIPTGTAARGDYVVTTTIAGTDPPQDTAEYYGSPDVFGNTYSPAG